jgi:hypothetical protein
MLILLFERHGCFFGGGSVSKQNNYSGIDISKSDSTAVDVLYCNFDDCTFAGSNSQGEFDLDFSSSQMQRVKIARLHLYNTIFLRPI